MALVVDTKKCVTADIDPLAVGLTLMVIGMDAITKANCRHAQARIDLINALDVAKYGRPSLTLAASAMVGASANVNNETYTKWAGRMTKNFALDRENNLKEKENASRKESLSGNATHAT